MMIKNVVFDIGNVFVAWSPEAVIERSLHHASTTVENQYYAGALLRSARWKALNRGELSVNDLARLYQQDFSLTPAQTDALFFHVMDHQTPIEGTEPLARALKLAGYRIFALTDNVHEIVAHLKQRYQFWPLFEGAVVSAEIGMLKPDDAIFAHLLTKFALDPAQTVFLDDVQMNVDGAVRAGLHSRLFKTADKCGDDLRQLGLSFRL